MSQGFSLESDVLVDDELRPGDLGAITEQHGRLYAAEYGYDRRFEAYVAAGLADAILGGREPAPRFWLVRSGSELLGSAAVCTGGPGVGQFRWFLLDPSVRSRGLGGRLLTECVEHCRRVGYRRVLLWTVDSLLGAAALYRRAGFVEVERGERAAPWGVPVTDVRYELTLG